MSATTAVVFFGSTSPNEPSFSPNGETLNLVEGSTAAWRHHKDGEVTIHHVDHPDNIIAVGAALTAQARARCDAVLVTSLPGSSVRGQETALAEQFEGSVYIGAITTGTAYTQWGEVDLSG